MAAFYAAFFVFLGIMAKKCSDNNKETMRYVRENSSKFRELFTKTQTQLKKNLKKNSKYISDKSFKLPDKCQYANNSKKKFIRFDLFKIDVDAIFKDVYKKSASDYISNTENDDADVAPPAPKFVEVVKNINKVIKEYNKELKDITKNNVNIYLDTGNSFDNVELYYDSYIHGSDELCIIMDVTIDND